MHASRSSPVGLLPLEGLYVFLHAALQGARTQVKTHIRVSCDPSGLWESWDSCDRSDWETARGERVLILLFFVAGPSVKHCSEGLLGSAIWSSDSVNCRIETRIRVCAMLNFVLLRREEFGGSRTPGIV